jgi:hypothetical protein
MKINNFLWVLVGNWYLITLSILLPELYEWTREMWTWFTQCRFRVQRSLVQNTPLESVILSGSGLWSLISGPSELVLETGSNAVALRRPVLVQLSPLGRNAREGHTYKETEDICTSRYKQISTSILDYAFHWTFSRLVRLSCDSIVPRSA